MTEELKPKKLHGEFQRCQDCRKLLINVGYICDQDQNLIEDEDARMRCAGCADLVCTEEKHGEGCNTTVMW